LPGRAPGPDDPGPAAATGYLDDPCGQEVNDSIRWLKAQLSWEMPEHVLLSTEPGQPPLSRWIAQMDSRPSEWSRAKLRICRALESSVTSVLLGLSSMPGRNVIPSIAYRSDRDSFGYSAASWLFTLVAASVAAEPMSTPPG